jgi:hypothetical protein
MRILTQEETIELLIQLKHEREMEEIRVLRKYISNQTKEIQELLTNQEYLDIYI